MTREELKSIRREEESKVIKDLNESLRWRKEFAEVFSVKSIEFNAEKGLRAISIPTKKKYLRIANEQCIKYLRVKYGGSI